MKAFRYDGRVALITGAARGLGRAHALLLASRGARVLVNDPGGSSSGQGADSRPAEQVVAEILALGGEAAANFDSVNEGEKLIQAAMDHFGRVDIVINNAGILRDTTLGKMTDEDWDAVLAVHLRGAYQVTRAAWPHLRQANYGRVVMTSSASGIYGNFGQSNYAAAKLGLYGLANTLALEGAKYNILVNTIAPLAKSRMTEGLFTSELFDHLKPEYVSPLVAYLCHESQTETGQLYEVGGGWVAKLRWERSLGAMLPPEEAANIEALAGAWPQISDWEGAEHPQAFQESFAAVYAGLLRLGLVSD
jgi:3-hydroxyacyl-CoA dehydrogenase/3a,7a,12a-trihydroxy-5b-cholest-24-enoyl-CoA hydratase